jgi:hypothetical protein
MKKEQNSASEVNTAMLFATCIFSTFSAAGNEGYLEQDGIDALSEIYRQNLTRVQEFKKAQGGKAVKGMVMKVSK